MSEPVIKVEHLGKRYRITPAQKPPETRMGALRKFAGASLRYVRSALREPTEEETLWALRDVSFQVEQGEVLGVIGQNGAGKSTLLKILCRITDPTEGRARIRGRIGSLLEVGTGFHPELTGRENVYLNGAILGMSKAEIDRKFDEIVDFSGVEKFIETPVKRYSSGMYVRLAFAVAAHLEPEILLVDEVLAVGDEAFQKKCLGKMDDVATAGRTILFISHNMEAVVELCSRVILLQSGTIAATGPPRTTVGAYLSQTSVFKRADLTTRSRPPGSQGKCALTFIETRNEQGELCSTFPSGATVVVEIGVLGEKGQEIVLGIGVRNEVGQQILHFDNRSDKHALRLGHGRSSFRLRFKNILNEGSYYLSAWVGDQLLVGHDYALNALQITVTTALSGKSLAKGAVIQAGRWCALAAERPE